MHMLIFLLLMLIYMINVNLHDNEIKHKFFINIIIITVLLISLRKVRFLL